MVTLHNLPKTTKRRKRAGRGISAGLGKTAGRGVKGQKARTGANIPTGFEGGQTKLYMRLPKRKGKPAVFTKRAAHVTCELLNRSFADGDRVTVATLKAKGLIPAWAKQVKVVGTGTLERQLKFSGLTFTKSVYQRLYGKKGG
ncbi:50S ribosomal protein L15 [Candidatus Berkelbacteria bacterium]|nr:50S ribosomal protein L15 [Candidatus Berkelbacteria bacterium]